MQKYYCWNTLWAINAIWEKNWSTIVIIILADRYIDTDYSVKSKIVFSIDTFKIINCVPFISVQRSWYPGNTQIRKIYLYSTSQVSDEAYKSTLC